MQKRKQITTNSFPGELYIDIFNKSPIGIYTLNAKGEIEIFNPRMLQMAGAKKMDQVIGLNAFKMPSYKKSGLVAFFKQGLNGKPFELEVEYTSQTGNKKTYRYYRGTPIFENDHKTVKGLLLMVEDITKSKLIEQKLRASQQKYKMIFDMSPEAILILDKKGNFIEMNVKINEWLGYSREELVGKNIFSLPIFTAKSKTIISKNFMLRMAGKEVEPYELEFLTKSGEKRIGIIFANPLKNEKGKIVADLVMTHDITERKNVEAMKSEFVSIVSHQLRTPLTGIKWCTELLLKDKTIQFTDKQNNFISQIATSNERMIRLIEELLDLSRIETGSKFVIRKQKTNIAEVIKNVVQDNMTLIEKKNIDLDINIPDNLRIKCDPEKIEHVWLNLIENALKYSKNKSKVKIRYKEKNGYYVFSIIDQGIGITQSQQASIFQKFFRARNASEIDSNGTGLGLYVAKAITEAHGGKIWFKSQEDKGTTFNFSLPK